jgi:BNR repeat-like domain
VTLSVNIGEYQQIACDGMREPQLFRLASGDLLLTYHAQADMHFSERQGLRSCDGGKSWQPEPRRGHREQAMGQASGGAVLGLDIYTFERTPGEYVGSYFKSEDGGQTFSGPHETVVRVNRVAALDYPTPEHIPPDDHVLRKFYQPLPDYYAPIVAKASRRMGPAFWRYPIEHKGRWVAAMQCRFHADCVYRTILVESPDDGRTWDFVSTIAYAQDEPRDGFCEPALITARDGSLLCIMRRGAKLPLAQCRSSDGGQTWSPPELLPGHGVDPDICLMSNGVLACSYGRPGTHIMFSEDGCGHSWADYTQIGDWHGSCYMGMAETTPGELLVVCDQCEAQGAGRDIDQCSIGRIRIQVRRT